MHSRAALTVLGLLKKIDTGSWEDRVGVSDLGGGGRVGGIRGKYIRV